MATAAQITANQSNAAHSTGPRTATGKAASALNGLRHGFRSQSVLIPGDDPAEYQELLDDLTAHFGPEDSDDCDITTLRHIREMTDAEWRLRRARTHHEWLLTAKIGEIAAAQPEFDALQLQVRAHEQLAADSAYFRQILRYEEKFERQYDRAYRAWTSYQDRCRRSHMSALDRMLKESLVAPLPPLPRAAEPKSTANTPQNDTAKPNPAPQTPRNASCPCGSGVKFKRCCGESAPPVLGRAA